MFNMLNRSHLYEGISILVRIRGALTGLVLSRTGSYRRTAGLEYVCRDLAKC